jgi:pyrroline-5-carboxylate reductase
MIHTIKPMKITFIGGGNMACAIIGGLVKQGLSAKNIQVVEPNPERVKWIINKFNASVTEEISNIDQDTNVIVLAVKPQIMDTVVERLAQFSWPRALFISIAAGVNIAQLANHLGTSSPIVRFMPNMPALIGVGMTGMFANESVSEEQRQQAHAVARACGEVLEVHKEELIDAVTAVSGSGPAYFLLMMASMQKASQTLGISEKEAQLLVNQTALGAASLAINSPLSYTELCQQIASPQGTTEAALNTLKDENFERATERAVQKAYNRAIELSGKPVDHFKSVVIARKANQYFDGKVTSRTLEFMDGSLKTLGIMLPGNYEFSTQQHELMEIASGEMQLKKPNSDQWVTIKAGDSFEIEANSSFQVHVLKLVDYCCSYS